MFTPPTSKPIRVTVPVTPEVLALFQRLSHAAGQSVGRAMGLWLEETSDGLEPMIGILEQHKKAPKKAIQSLQAYAGTLSDLTDDLFDKVKFMDRDAEHMAAAVASADRTVKTLRKGGLTPPSSNTGGKGTKTAKTGAGVLASKKGFSMPPAKVQAYADNNGLPPKKGGK